MSMHVKRPHFGSAVFCDSTRLTEAGKMDCYGAFTSLLAWAYPTSYRAWHAIVTMYDLPHDNATVTATISRARGHKKLLVSADVLADELGFGNLVALPLAHQFAREGKHYVEFTIVGTTVQMRVPILVVTQKWPTFSERELRLLRRSRVIPKNIRVTVQCMDCGRAYVFEATPLPDHTLAGGVIPFPDSGVVECDECGRLLHVKDLQGQLLSSIKRALATTAGGK